MCENLTDKHCKNVMYVKNIKGEKNVCYHFRSPQVGRSFAEIILQHPKTEYMN